MPWERRRYRKNKVWIDVDEHGRPVLDERGLAALRYKPQDERTYTVRPEEVRDLENEVSPGAMEPPEAKISPEAMPPPQAGEPPPKGEAPRNAKAPKARAAAGADAGPAPETIVIYTDGACSGNPGPAGLGAVLIWKGHEREIQQYLGHATNNEAELRAVLVALTAVTRPTLRVEVHTDSEYVIGVLSRGHKVKANVELVRAIHREMDRFENLHFVKVPGHAGVPGNERADRLARDAVEAGRD